MHPNCHLDDSQIELRRLTVRGDGEPNLYSYRRVIVTVNYTVASVLPDKYHLRGQSDLSATVTPDSENNFDFDLKPSVASRGALSEDRTHGSRLHGHRHCIVMTQKGARLPQLCLAGLILSDVL